MCDFVVRCPTAFLVQRIKLDPGWRASTLFSLHRIFQWNIMRKEDRINCNLMWPAPPCKDVDLNTLPRLIAIQNHVGSVFLYFLAVHLRSWIYFLAQSTGNWAECCLREYDRAREKFCCVCFVRYFLYLWHKENHSSELPPMVAKIQNCKWTIPVVVWDDAKTRLFNLRFSKTITQPPCFCCKV